MVKSIFCKNWNYLQKQENNKKLVKMKQSVGKRGFTAKARRHLRKYFFFILTTIKRVIYSNILQYKNYSNWVYFGKTNERGALFNENIIETKSN